MGLARAMSAEGPRGRRWLGLLVASLSVGVVAWRLGHDQPPGLVVSAYGCLAALALALAAWGLGSLALRHVHDAETPVDGLTRAACATALGFVMLMALLQVGGLALGSLGWSGAFVLALALAVLLSRAARPARIPETHAARLLLVALGLVVLPYALRGLAPLNDWDSATCHLPIASRLVEAGPWFTTPDLHLLYRPALPHTLYAALLSLGAEAGIVPLVLLATLVSGALVWSLARDVAGLRAARWAVVVFASISVVLELGTDPRVDTWLMLAYLLAVYAVLRLLVSARPGTWATVGVLGAAACLGTKYNGILHAALLAMLVAAAWWWRRRPGLRAAGAGVAISLLLTAPFLVGYLRNHVAWGDPVYPFHSQVRVHEEGSLLPLQDLLTDAPGWVRDEAAEDALRNAIEEADSPLRRAAEGIHPFLWLEATWNRGAFATKRGHGSSPFLVLAPFVMLLGLRRRAALLGLLFLVGTVAFTASKPVLRYQLPSLAVGAAAAGVVLGRVRPRGLVAGLLVLLAAWIVPTWLGSWRSFHRMDLGAWWMGKEDDRTWLARIGHNGETGLALASLWLVQAQAAGVVEPTDRVWMVGEGKIHGFPLDAHPSPGREGRDWLLVLRSAGWDVERLRDRLWREGYRWLLVNDGWFRFSELNGFVNRSYAVATRRTLDRFLATCCDPPAHEAEGVRLARLRAPSHVAPPTNGG